MLDIKKQKEMKLHKPNKDEILLINNLLSKMNNQSEELKDDFNNNNNVDVDKLTKQIINLNNYITLIRSKKYIKDYHNEIIQSSHDIIPLIDMIISKNKDIINKENNKLLESFKNTKIRYYDTVTYADLLV